MYLEYDGVRPMPESGFKTPNITNVSECKNLCEQDEACESFALVQDEAKIVCLNTPCLIYMYINNKFPCHPFCVNGCYSKPQLFGQTVNQCQ